LQTFSLKAQSSGKKRLLKCFEKQIQIFPERRFLKSLLPQHSLGLTEEE
jgi:hypothetical protein